MRIKSHILLKIGHVASSMQWKNWTAGSLFRKGIEWFSWPELQAHKGDQFQATPPKQTLCLQLNYNGLDNKRNVILRDELYSQIKMVVLTAIKRRAASILQDART